MSFGAWTNLAKLFAVDAYENKRFGESLTMYGGILFVGSPANWLGTNVGSCLMSLALIVYH